MRYLLLLLLFFALPVQAQDFGRWTRVDITPPPPDTTPCDPPTSLVATAGNGQVTLTWSDPVCADLNEIEVQRSEATNDDYSFLAVVDEAIETYVDNAVTNGETYFYKTRSRDDADNLSIFSNEDSATPSDVGADFMTYDEMEATTTCTVGEKYVLDYLASNNKDGTFICQTTRQFPGVAERGIDVPTTGGRFFTRCSRGTTGVCDIEPTFTYNYANPIEFDWFDGVVNGDDITGLLNGLAEDVGASFWVRVPTTAMTLKSSFIDFTPLAFTDFVVKGSGAAVVIDALNLDKLWWADNGVTNVEIGDAALSLTFLGRRGTRWQFNEVGRENWFDWDGDGNWIPCHNDAANTSRMLSFKGNAGTVKFYAHVKHAYWYGLHASASEVYLGPMIFDEADISLSGSDWVQFGSLDGSQLLEMHDPWACGGIMAWDGRNVTWWASEIPDVSWDDDLLPDNTRGNRKNLLHVNGVGQPGTWVGGVKMRYGGGGHWFAAGVENIGSEANPFRFVYEDRGWMTADERYADLLLRPASNEEGKWDPFVLNNTVVCPDPPPAGTKVWATFEWLHTTRSSHAHRIGSIEASSEVSGKYFCADRGSMTFLDVYEPDLQAQGSPGGPGLAFSAQNSAGEMNEFESARGTILHAEYTAAPPVGSTRINMTGIAREALVTGEWNYLEIDADHKTEDVIIGSPTVATKVYDRIVIPSKRNISWMYVRDITIQHVDFPDAAREIVEVNVGVTGTVFKDIEAHGDSFFDMKTGTSGVCFNNGTIGSGTTLVKNVAGAVDLGGGRYLICN